MLRVDPASKVMGAISVILASQAS